MFPGPGNAENEEGVWNPRCLERFLVLGKFLCYSVVTDCSKYGMKMQTTQMEVVKTWARQKGLLKEGEVHWLSFVASEAKSVTSVSLGSFYVWQELGLSVFVAHLSSSESSLAVLLRSYV